MDVGILTSVTLKIFVFLLSDSVSAWLSLIVFPTEDVFFLFQYFELILFS